MPVFVVGTEKTLAALDRRLFKSGVPAGAITRVRKAIRDANPDVDLDDLSPGQVLKLPRSPELKARADLSFDDSISKAVSATQDQLRDDLKELAATAVGRLRDDAAGRRVLAKQLDSREVQAVASQDDSVMAALKSALEGIAENDSAGDGLQAVVKQAVAEWSDELQAIDRLLP